MGKKGRRRGAKEVWLLSVIVLFICSAYAQKQEEEEDPLLAMESEQSSSIVRFPKDLEAVESSRVRFPIDEITFTTEESLRDDSQAVESETRFEKGARVHEFHDVVGYQYKEQYMNMPTAEITEIGDEPTKQDFQEIGNVVEVLGKASEWKPNPDTFYQSEVSSFLPEVKDSNVKINPQMYEYIEPVLEQEPHPQPPAIQQSQPMESLPHTYKIEDYQDHHDSYSPQENTIYSAPQSKQEAEAIREYHSVSPEIHSTPPQPTPHPHASITPLSSVGGNGGTTSQHHIYYYLPLAAPTSPPLMHTLGNYFGGMADSIRPRVNSMVEALRSSAARVLARPPSFQFPIHENKMPYGNFQEEYIPTVGNFQQTSPLKVSMSVPKLASYIPQIFKSLPSPYRFIPSPGYSPGPPPTDDNKEDSNSPPITPGYSPGKYPQDESFEDFKEPSALDPHYNKYYSTVASGAAEEYSPPQTPKPTSSYHSTWPTESHVPLPPKQTRLVSSYTPAEHAGPVYGEASGENLSAEQVGLNKPVGSLSSYYLNQAPAFSSLGERRPLKSYYTSPEEYYAILMDRPVSSSKDAYFQQMSVSELEAQSYADSSPGLPFAYGSFKPEGSVSDDFADFHMQNSYGTPYDLKYPSSQGYYKTNGGSWVRVPKLSKTKGYAYKYSTTKQLLDPDIDPLYQEIEEALGLKDVVCENSHACSAESLRGLADSVDLTKRPKGLQKLLKKLKGRGARRLNGKRGRRFRCRRGRRCRKLKLY